MTAHLAAGTGYPSTRLRTASLFRAIAQQWCMGFGSYDESEQESEDTDYDDDGAVSVHEHDHDGEVTVEGEVSPDDLVDRLQNMK